MAWPSEPSIAPEPKSSSGAVTLKPSATASRRSATSTASPSGTTLNLSSTAESVWGAVKVRPVPASRCPSASFWTIGRRPSSASPLNSHAVFEDPALDHLLRPRAHRHRADRHRLGAHDARPRPRGRGRHLPPALPRADLGHEPTPLPRGARWATGAAAAARHRAWHSGQAVAPGGELRGEPGARAPRGSSRHIAAARS